MKSVKTRSKLLIACVALISIAALLKAGYYKPDFFPIGLTGLNFTGYGRPNSTGCPYGNVYGIDPQWSWDGDTNSEQSLIYALGVNCLVFEEDGFLGYMGSLDTTECRSENNYLYRVCIPSFMDDGDSANPEHIYIIIFTDITDSLPDSLNLED